MLGGKVDEVFVRILCDHFAGTHVAPVPTYMYNAKCSYVKPFIHACHML